MINADLVTQVKLTAGFEKVPWDLMCAIIERESAGDQWVIRYESRWSWFVEPQKYASKLNISYTTERTLQQFSYGLVQIMGSVARELGYDDHLTKLCADPAIAIQYGCRKMKQLLDKHRDEQTAISAYNAGTPFRDDNGSFINAVYVQAVEQFRKQYA